MNSILILLLIGWYSIKTISRSVFLFFSLFFSGIIHWYFDWLLASRSHAVHYSVATEFQKVWNNIRVNKKKFFFLWKNKEFVRFLFLFYKIILIFITGLFFFRFCLATFFYWLCNLRNSSNTQLEPSWAQKVCNEH